MVLIIPITVHIFIGFGVFMMQCVCVAHNFIDILTIFPPVFLFSYELCNILLFDWLMSYIDCSL